MGLPEKNRRQKMPNFKYFPINIISPYEQAIAAFVGDGLSFSKHYRPVSINYRQLIHQSLR